MTPYSPTLFATRLLQARQRRAWSLRELAGKTDLSITAAALSKYEKGQMRPSARVLDALCVALGVTEDFFERPLRAPLGEVKFRKRTSLGVKEELSLRSHAGDFFERYAELEQLLGLEVEFENPIADREITSGDDVEAAALAVREAWNLGLSPIPSMVGLLEQQNFLVWLERAPETFDGFAGLAGMRQVVALNASFPTDRLRLSGGHELGHALLRFSAGRWTAKEEEALCFRFGGALMMPEPVFREAFGGHRQHVTVAELVRLKSIYGMSCAAIMKRAATLGLVAESMMERFWTSWTVRGYRTKDPGSCLFDEEPRRFDGLLQRAVAEQRISIAKAAVLANVPEDEFRRGLEILP